jgi:hypothetical protein
MQNTEIKDVGTFEIKSGKVIVSDPCYDRETWCQGKLDNVLNGTWKAILYIYDEGEWGKRVGHILVHHVDHPISLDHDEWEQQDFDVGVDSGQAGIYDDADFRGCNVDEWYDLNCGLTYNPKDINQHGGVLKGGAVSSSGYGDGGYDCSVVKNFSIPPCGKIIAIEINFGLDNVSESDMDFYKED